MNSPYDNNVGSNWGPPAGLSSMLAAQTQQGMEGMQNGAKMFDAAAAQFKQRQDEGKAADYLFKAHPEYLEQLGIHPEQFKTMGSVDKSRAATAVMQDNAMKDMMAKRADMESQTNERNSIADWRTAQAANANEEDQGFSNMMQHMASLGRGDTLSPDSIWKSGGQLDDTNNAFVPPTTPRWSPETQALLEAGASAGRTNPKVAAAMMRQLMPMIAGGEAGGSAPMDFKEDPVTGQRFAVKGKVAMPSGVNPEKFKDLDAIPIHDPDTGEVIGHGTLNKNGTITQLKRPTPAATDLTPGQRQQALTKLALQHAELITKRSQYATDSEGKPVPGLAEGYDRAISGLEQNIRDLKAAGAKIPATAGAGATGKGNGIAPPKAGDVVNGYKFKGGDPKDLNSWEKVATP